MTTHLHEALKIVAVPLYNILNRQIKILGGISILNSQKLIEWTGK